LPKGLDIRLRVLWAVVVVLSAFRDDGFFGATADCSLASWWPYSVRGKNVMARGRSKRYFDEENENKSAQDDSEWPQV
jgi:hypothetical protein